MREIGNTFDANCYIHVIFISSHPEVFLGQSVRKICSKFTVNLLHLFRKTILGMPLNICCHAN